MGGPGDNGDMPQMMLILMVLSLGIAVAVLGTLVALNRPPEGWRAFLRDAREAFRGPDDVVTDAPDLQSLGIIEPGTGYATPGELRLRYAQRPVEHGRAS